MSQKIDQSMVMKTLDWAYEKAITIDLPGMDSAYDLAKDYSEQQGSLVDKVNSLIRWQNTKAGTSGFVTGLGGLLTLPVAIPANIASVMFVQIRMIAAIAIMGGHDPKRDKVRTLVYLCLCGNGAREIIQQAGIRIGEKMAISLIKRIPSVVITNINRMVGFRLLTRFGQKGVINLGKAIPLVGGVIGAAVDGFSTNTIGNVARDMFIEGAVINTDNVRKVA